VKGLGIPITIGILRYLLLYSYVSGNLTFYSTDGSYCFMAVNDSVSLFDIGTLF
jgi:hypothetical protein